MSKFQEPFEDTIEIFDKILRQTNLDTLINVKILTNNSLKEIGKVSKANDIVKYLSKVDVIIILNELIFEMLNDEQRQMVADELLAHVSFNHEKDTVVVNKPDINVHSLVLKKYGSDNYIETHTLIKEAISQKADMDA
jgi:hypothetical protein